MSQETVLYSWYRSSCSWRVRTALAWKGIPFKNVPVGLNSGDQHSAEFLKVNPMGQVPVLCIDGEVLVQSVAVLEYLEETRPEKPLLPKDPKQRAQVRRIVELIVSGIQPHQNKPGLEVPAGTPEEWKFAWSPEWGSHWIEKGFQALEETLKKTSGKYAVGNEVTLADVCLVPQVYNAGLLKVNLEPFPTIRRINDSLVLLEAFRVSHPAVQPDYPGQGHQRHY